MRCPKALATATKKKNAIAARRIHSIVVSDSARISLDILLEELREEKVEDVKKIALAMWEADGKISVFLHPQYNPITPSHYQMETEPFYLPRTIIKDGKIISKELKQIHKDEDWVISKLRNSYQTEVKDVLLGTVDNKEHITVFFYK